ncbi:MAG: 5-formyltetrahydrofolate cyclo-ligase [Betaproteobacteria bacterium]
MAGKVGADASPKATLRRHMIAARDALPPGRRHELSAAITAQVLALDAYRNANCVLAYMSFGSEFDTTVLIADALASGRQLCLPRVNRNTRRLELHVVENVDSVLQSGTWGIREPRAERPPADLARIDFVLLPGVAFTPRCERLGYGGGFYDRLIPRFASRPPLVAAAFALQVCDAVPVDANDQRIDVVITENSFYCNCG